MGEDRFAPRPGELRLATDPAGVADAPLAFIGRARTPWGPDDCPKNLGQARARGQAAWLEIDAPYRPGLEGLAPGMAVVVLTWLHAAPRDLIRQAPRHRDTPAGTFALRSPVRPNPVGLAVVRCTGLDAAAGRVELEALDVYDGTPLIDLKPWLASVDAPHEGAAPG